MDSVDLQEMYDTLEDYLPHIGYELEFNGGLDSADDYRKRWVLMDIEASISRILDSIQILQSMENKGKGDE